MQYSCPGCVFVIFSKYYITLSYVNVALQCRISVGIVKKICRAFWDPDCKMWVACHVGEVIGLDTYFMCYEPCNIQTLCVIEHYHYYERFVFVVNIIAKTAAVVETRISQLRYVLDTHCHTHAKLCILMF